MALATVKFRTGEIKRGFANLERQAATVQKALKKARPRLRKDLTEHAQKESGPEGRWAKRVETDRADRRQSSSRRSQRRRRIGPRQILGDLPRTVSTKVKGLSLIARSPIPWSGVHNEGGRVGRGSILPARPFVFLSDPFLNEAERILADHIVEGW